jgi:hypothetical protein
MKAKYKGQTVTVMKLGLIKTGYLTWPILQQVKIKFSDQSTDYVDANTLDFNS